MCRKSDLEFGFELVDLYFVGLFFDERGDW